MEVPLHVTVPPAPMVKLVVVMPLLLDAPIVMVAPVTLILPVAELYLVFRSYVEAARVPPERVIFPVVFKLEAKVSVPPDWAIAPIYPFMVAAESKVRVYVPAGMFMS